MEEIKDLGLTDTNGGCSCCSSVPASAGDSAASSDAVATDYLVAGMTCSHCVASVTEEITALDGVERVVVDLNAGGTSRVTVHSSAPLERSSVRSAVEEAGYELAEQAS